MFFCRRVWISVRCKYIFLKYLKLPIYLYFCRPDRTILGRLKKKEKSGKIQDMFLRRLVYMSVKSSHVFLKILKLPIYLYFCRLGRTFLNRLKKKKKNMEKLKIFFYGVRFKDWLKVVTFS